MKYWEHRGGEGQAFINLPALKNYAIEKHPKKPLSTSIASQRLHSLFRYKRTIRAEPVFEVISPV